MRIAVFLGTAALEDRRGGRREMETTVTMLHYVTLCYTRYYRQTDPTGVFMLQTAQAGAVRDDDRSIHPMLEVMEITLYERVWQQHSWPGTLHDALNQAISSPTDRWAATCPLSLRTDHESAPTAHRPPRV